jgi:hypothetical protein
LVLLLIPFFFLLSFLFFLFSSSSIPSPLHADWNVQHATTQAEKLHRTIRSVGATKSYMRRPFHAYPSSCKHTTTIPSTLLHMTPCIVGAVSVSRRTETSLLCVCVCICIYIHLLIDTKLPRKFMHSLRKLPLP